MEDGISGLEEAQPSSKKEQNIGEVLLRLCPIYMSYGMTVDEYWHGDPYLAVFYRQLHEIKRDELNEQLWWSNYYNFVAISTALSNIHLDGKQHKLNKYPEEPFRIREMTEEEKEAAMEKERRKMIAYLDGLKAAYDAKQKG